MDELQKSIINESWKFTDGAISHYSPELLDLVDKLLVKEPTLRLGAKADMQEILEHPVFQKKIISSDMVALKPKAYNTNQDFLDIEHRQAVAAEFNDKTDFGDHYLEFE